jgi:hypothetical protein
MLDQLEIDRENEIKMNRESGYVKQSLLRSQNGPILLIVCASCKNAQRIYEVISEIIDLSVRQHYKEINNDNNNNNESFRPYKKLKALLLQGGGHESLYDVPLINGKI